MAEAVWVVVMRGLTAGGVQLSPGDIVDAATWRTRETLIRQRYIRPATAKEVAEAEEEVEIEVAPPPPKAKVRNRKRR